MWLQTIDRYKVSEQNFEINYHQAQTRLYTFFQWLVFVNDEYLLFFILIIVKQRVLTDRDSQL